MPYQIKNGIIYSGNAVTLTQAQYDALTTAEKSNGTVYYIYDSDAMIEAQEVGLDGGNVETLAGSVATFESSPSTAVHAEGEYILYQAQLYKVTSAIAVGEDLTVGSNIEATNLGNELNNGLTTYTLLWTNPDPTSSFSPQTISLDLSEYDRIEVVSYVNRSSTLVFSTILHKGLRGTLSGIYAARMVIRNLTDGYTNSGISFGSGVNINTYGNETTDNAYVIPYKIYGIKSGS